MPDAKAADRPWWLYVLLCRGEKLYIGVAPDVEARFAKHSVGKGAFFTKLNPPQRVLAKRLYPSKSSAMKAEYALKQVKLAEKWAWVELHQGE